MKTIFSILIALTSLIFARPYPEWDQLQVDEYIHHCELQTRSTLAFLSQFNFFKNQRILDIGCRDGRITAFLSQVNKNGIVKGLESNEYLLDYALKQYDLNDYPNLSFSKGFFTNFQEDNNSYDIVTSFYSLHGVKDKTSALKEVYRVLKTDAKFLCVIPPPPDVNPHLFKAVCETAKSPKWIDYFPSYHPPSTFNHLEDYLKLLQEVGLKVTHAQYVKTKDPFVDDQDFIDWFKVNLPYREVLPKDLQDEFIYDIIRLYTSLYPEARDSKGTLRAFWGRYEILAIK